MTRFIAVSTRTMAKPDRVTFAAHRYLKPQNHGAILKSPLLYARPFRNSISSQGARMNISYSNLHAELRKEVEDKSQRHVDKLNRLLKKYAPDSISLHGCVDKNPRTSEFELSLNLVMPTGTLHATGTGPDPRSCVKAAFMEIETQVKKHQQKLRKDYVWKRKRAGTALKAYEVPSAD
jgi:ribosome-associated translation inhibitor RaiA